MLSVSFTLNSFLILQGEMEITPAFYAHLTSSLMALANGRVAVVFEVRRDIYVCY